MLVNSGTAVERVLVGFMWHPNMRLKPLDETVSDLLCVPHVEFLVSQYLHFSVKHVTSRERLCMTRMNIQ